MSEPRANSRAFEQIAERWDDARTERTLGEARRRQRQRKLRSRLLGLGASLSLLAIGVSWLWQTRANPTQLALRANQAPATAAANQAPPAAGAKTPLASAIANPSVTPGQRMQLADGSEIALLAPDTRVVVKEVSPSSMVVELASGHARFEIVHREDRVFRVISGDISVEVLGTIFELEREAARTRVSVTRGRVAVLWNAGRNELAAGEAGWFPKPAVYESGRDGSSHNLSAQKHAQRSNPVARTSSWREPAEHGDFARAYKLLANTPQPPADDVEELMLAADTARLSGHPEAALPFLTRVMGQHASDARAPLAAFTLGSLLMQQLGRAREAESAYAQARALSPNTSLAQDALARQVEAAHRAGDAALAAKLASEYLALYPDGRRVHTVRRFGGLDRE